MAEIIPLPTPEPPEPDCRTCIHAMLGPVTYCTAFKEEIDNEALTASECEWFDPDEYQ